MLSPKKDKIHSDKVSFFNHALIPYYNAHFSMFLSNILSNLISYYVKTFYDKSTFSLQAN